MPSSDKRSRNDSRRPAARRDDRRPQPPAQREPEAPSAWDVLRADLDRNRGVYADLLGTGKRAATQPEVDRFLVTCYQHVWTKPDLLSVNRDSLLLAFAEAAVVRISLNPTAKEGYIEIRSNVARFATQYQGLIKLMHRGSDIDFLYADVVRRGDHFRNIGGSDPRLEHEAVALGFEPDDYDTDEAILAAYAVVKVKGATRAIHEVARRSEIMKARALSKGKGGEPPSPAWAAWFNRMARKLPLRRLANDLPGADEARMILSIEGARERGEDVAIERAAEHFPSAVGIGGFNPSLPKTSADELAALMASSDPMPAETEAEVDTSGEDDAGADA